MSDPLRQAILAGLHPAVALSIWDGDAAGPDYPEESAAVDRAVPVRAAEFRKGRACARAALAQLGVAPGPLPVGTGRAPVWPPDFVGSITHCRGLVAAVAASAARVIALGLDAEPAGPLPDGTQRLVLHRLDRQGEGGSIEKLVFSAKESIYKAIFPLTGISLDFLDVVVELDEREGRFRAAWAPEMTPSTPWLAALRGAYVVTDAFVVTACWAAAQT